MKSSLSLQLSSASSDQCLYKSCFFGSSSARALSSLQQYCSFYCLCYRAANWEEWQTGTDIHESIITGINFHRNSSKFNDFHALNTLSGIYSRFSAVFKLTWKMVHGPIPPWCSFQAISMYYFNRLLSFQFASVLIISTYLCICNYYLLFSKMRKAFILMAWRYVVAYALYNAKISNFD